MSAWNLLKLKPLFLTCAGLLLRRTRKAKSPWISESRVQPCFHFSNKKEGSAEEGGPPPHNYRSSLCTLIKLTPHTNALSYLQVPLKELIWEKPHLFAVSASKHFPLHRWVTWTTQVFSRRPRGAKDEHKTHGCEKSDALILTRNPHKLYVQY